MKKYMFSLVLLLMFLPLFVSAKNLTAVQYIENIASSNNADKTSINAIGNTGLAYDGTVDNNLRYIGANPNNYVDIGDRYKTDIYKGYQWGTDIYRFYSSYDECINSQFYGDGEAYKNTGCEKVHSKGDIIYWRIIGVMNNINSNNKIETKLKLIREESIGYFFIDSTPPNINDGGGISEWAVSDLNKLLNEGYDENKEEFYYNRNNNTEYETRTVNNSLYWNSKNGMCIEPNDNAYVNLCDFSGIGLSETSKKFLDIATWDTGTYSEQDYYDVDSKPIDFYNWERSGIRTKYVSNDSTADNVERTAHWTGRIGLIYVSDLGFSTSGGNETSRQECLNISMSANGFSSNDNNHWYKKPDCQNNSWLDTDSYYESTFNFDDQYDIASTFIYNHDEVNIFTTWISNGGSVHPVFYLKNDAIISSGDGKKDNPYKLMLEESNSTKLTISSKRDIKDIFSDIEPSKINWKVEDESILKIENNTIIPLKVGVTEILGELDGIQYRLKVEVTEDLLVNPKTYTPIIIIISLLTIIISSIILINKKSMRIS